MEFQVTSTVKYDKFIIPTSLRFFFMCEGKMLSILYYMFQNTILKKNNNIDSSFFEFNNNNLECNIIDFYNQQHTSSFTDLLFSHPLNGVKELKEKFVNTTKDIEAYFNEFKDFIEKYVEWKKKQQT
jgi:hypothetical protein